MESTWNEFSTLKSWSVVKANTGLPFSWKNQLLHSGWYSMTCSGSYNWRTAAPSTQGMHLPQLPWASVDTFQNSFQTPARHTGIKRASSALSRTLLLFLVSKTALWWDPIIMKSNCSLGLGTCIWRSEVNMSIFLVSLPQFLGQGLSVNLKLTN